MNMIMSTGLGFTFVSIFEKMHYLLKYGFTREHSKYVFITLLIIIAVAIIWFWAKQSNKSSNIRLARNVSRTSSIFKRLLYMITK